LLDGVANNLVAPDDVTADVDIALRIQADAIYWPYRYN
jgi:hypothetical protein